MPRGTVYKRGARGIKRGEAPLKSLSFSPYEGERVHPEGSP